MSHAWVLASPLLFLAILLLDVGFITVARILFATWSTRGKEVCTLWVTRQETPKIVLLRAPAYELLCCTGASAA